MKEISKEELNALLREGVIRNTRAGIVDRDGEPTGYCKTRHKRYIEDKYADWAKSINGGKL